MEMWDVVDGDGEIVEDDEGDIQLFFTLWVVLG